MNNKKIKTALPLFFSIAIILGMIVGYKLHSNMPNSKNFFNLTGKNKLEEVMELINQRYVDNINIDSVSEIALEEILTTLDPHSVYIPASSISEINEDLEGKFQGIGVEFNVFNDTINILAVLENGPAYKGKLNVGDKILAVNDSNAVGNIKSDKFKNWVKGPEGTEVKLKIQREKVIFEKKLIRGTIPIKSIDASYMIDNENGYIRLNRFSSNSYEEFMTSLEKLKKSGLENLILDLRDNGGGILEEAVDIADEFIGNDEMIVYTEGKSNPKKEYLCKRPGLFEKGKLIVLMNEGSASASEVLAGALQDLDRATIIGRRSFGKGLVQEQYTLSDGSALRLTTARYYTPLGRSIQKSYKNGVMDYQKEIMNRYHNQLDQKTDTTTSNHIKSYKTASGKILYGGGGIWPDLFIGIDSSFFDTSLNKLYEKNTIANFAYNYYIQNRLSFKYFNNCTDFNLKYKLPNNIIDNLIEFGKREGVYNINLNKNSKEFLRNRIKALIARISWGDNGYYQVLNSTDLSILKGIEKFQ